MALGASAKELHFLHSFVSLYIAIAWTVYLNLAGRTLYDQRMEKQKQGEDGEMYYDERESFLIS